MAGKSSTSNQSNPVTTNVDRRLAVQDGQGVSGDNSSAFNYESYSNTYAPTSSTSFSDSRAFTDASTFTDNSNSDEAIRYITGQGSDTITALTNAGRSIIENSGGAIVELGKFQGAQNTESFNTLVGAGGDLLDKLLDKASEGYGLAAKVVDSFTPTESKEADNTKYLYIAGAVVAAAVLLGGKK